jgi:hypothetical protein
MAGQAGPWRDPGVAERGRDPTRCFMADVA